MDAMKLDAIRHLERNAKRVGEIVGVLAKYGLSDWATHLHYDWIQERLRSPEGQSIAELTTGERLRLAFTELGTTFIKLGQMLSTRPDLVGPEVARELTRLQTRVPADAFETIRDTIESDLKRPLEAMFLEFETEPIAAASIAQVHGARLPSGEEVVVKVQRRGIADKIMPDLEILAGLAELAEKHVPQARPYQPSAVVRRFRRSLLRELDFTTERRNLEEFARRFADDETVHFPGTHADTCSRRVLTMERLDGILGNNAEGLAASGEDLDEFARRGARMYLQMIFRDGFYHADPHPGNLMLLPGGVVGVLDCGMTGRIDEELSEAIEEVVMTLVDRRSADLADIVLRIGSTPPGIPRDQLQADLGDFVSDYAGRSVHDLDLSGALESILEIVRRYRITLPPAFSLLLRTLVELEGTAQRLSPAFSLAEVLVPYYGTLVRQRLAPRRILGRFRQVYRHWERFFDVLPRDLAEVLARVRDGSFQVHLDHRHLDPVINRLVMGVVTAALFLGSTMLWSTKAAPVVGNISVFGGAGYAVSLYFAWRLLRAIRKSGDIQSKE